MDKQIPQRVCEIAKKVHEWRNDPAKFNRFLEQVQACFAGINEAQRKWENDRKNYFSKIPKDSPLRDEYQCPQSPDSCSKKGYCTKDPSRCFNNQNFYFGYDGMLIQGASEVWVPEEISPDEDSSTEEAEMLPDPQLETALLMARLELLFSQTQSALPSQK